jgi:hypothetical protein
MRPIFGSPCPSVARLRLSLAIPSLAIPLATVALMMFPDQAIAQGSASQPGVRFDVPQVVEAKVLESSGDGASDLLITFEMTISIIVDSLSAPRIDQLVVEMTPRGGSAMVVDYAPRTELASNYSGGIEVQRTDESNRSVAMSIDAGYPPVGGGNLSAARSDKNVESVKFNRVAPMHLIAASGTTRRGRGVYFKFRSTDQQIIEGDRTLRVTFRVPSTWQGEWIEVLILGDSHPKGFTSGFSSGVASLAGISAKPQRVGAGRFLVATYRPDSDRARDLARRLADAEAEMRDQVQRLGSIDRSGFDPFATARVHGSDRINNPADLVRHVSRRIDWTESSGRELADKGAISLHRALDGSLEPHTDRTFKDLPVDTRAAFLEYLAARKAFVSALMP